MTTPTRSRNEASALWVRWRLPLLIAVAALGILYALYLARSGAVSVHRKPNRGGSAVSVHQAGRNRLPFRERHPNLTRIGTVLVIYVLFVAAMAV